MKDPQFHREMARRLRAQADDIEEQAKFQSRELRARASQHEKQARETETTLDQGTRRPAQ